MATRVISILWGMASPEIQTHRTHGQDLQAERLAQELATAAGMHNPDSGLDALSEVLTYTVGMVFDWADETPPPMRPLQTLWQRYIAGAPAPELYRIFSTMDYFVLSGRRENLDAKPSITGVLGWVGALYQALTPWEPPTEWKLKTELPPEQANDPT